MSDQTYPIVVGAFDMPSGAVFGVGKRGAAQANRDRRDPNGIPAMMAAERPIPEPEPTPPPQPPIPEPEPEPEPVPSRGASPRRMRG